MTVSSVVSKCMKGYQRKIDYRIDTGQYLKKGRPQKSEKFNFSKRTNKSVDHKSNSFAIN